MGANSGHHGSWGLNLKKNCILLVNSKSAQKTELVNILNTWFGRFFEKIGFTKGTPAIGLGTILDQKIIKLQIIWFGLSNLRSFYSKKYITKVIYEKNSRNDQKKPFILTGLGK